MDREDNSEKETTHSLKLQVYESEKSELLQVCYISPSFNILASHACTASGSSLEGNK